MIFTFVTAYFELDTVRNDFYFQKFRKLAETEFPIILYLDKKLENRVEELKKYENVKVILISWEDLFINKFIKENKIENIQIVKGNPKKDTLNFLIVINSKTFFLKEASMISDKSLIIWIDFGIMKITNNVEHFKNNFSKIGLFNKIIIPGGFRNLTLLDDYQLMKSVFWRFLGGIVICPRELIDRLNDECNKEMCALLLKNKLTFEGNIWCNVEYKNRDLIKYFKADCNSLMFSFCDKKRLAFCVIENDKDNEKITEKTEKTKENEKTIENEKNNEVNIEEKIKTFVTDFKGKCEGYVINILNLKPNLLVSENIINYVNNLRARNCNIKLYIDNLKNFKRTNNLIVQTNLIDYCWELGWDINYTYGLFEKENILIPLNADFYEHFITEKIN